MKTWSNLAAAFAVCALLGGVAGCASDDPNRRGVDQTGEIASDSWITTKVKSELAVEEDVSATRIHVETYEGVVTLSGTAESQTEADRAVALASQVKGVKSVVNNLEVKS
jgi:hyperosmotically inducible periplasmic protein